MREAPSLELEAVSGGDSRPGETLATHIGPFAGNEEKTKKN